MRRTWAIGLAAGLLAAVLATGRLAAEEKPVSDDKIAKVKAALPAKATARPKKPRHLLIFSMTKGFRHGGAIDVGNVAIAMMGKKTGAYTAEATEDPSIFEPGKLDRFDAICFNNTTGTLFTDEAMKKNLMDFVRGGKGIVGVHSCTDCFYDWKEFGDMMGGYFSGHPWNENVGVKVDDPKHPVVRSLGGKGFMVVDEIYQFKAPYSRDKLRVLLSLDMAKTKDKGQRPDKDFAVAWVQEWGKGRVFYCSLGHDGPIFWNPTVMAIYLDGIQYALGDLKADATPSAKLSPQPKPGLVPDDAGKKKAAARPVELRLFAAPKADDGWIPLFDGKDLGQWQNAGGGKPGAGWVVQDGAMVREKNAGDIWTKERFGDFVLDLEFKTEGNSGVFIRTDNPKDCVQTGIEIQVERGGGREKLGRNDVGSVYDCLAPSKNPVKDSEWNRTVITAKDNKITIVINDVQVIDMDLNQWTEPNQNPDGSKNKFNKALKDFKRDGHIGFQDHGAKVSYRNVKIKPLKAEK